MIRSLSIIIPAYNEEKGIEKAVRETADFFRDFDFEIIVVNDGSIDQTSDIVKVLQAGLPNLRLIDFSKNQGKGAAIKEGALVARKDWILFLDVDFSTHPREFNKFNPFFNECDIIIGSRAVKGANIIKRQNMFKVFAGRTGNKFIRLFLGLPFNDTQCGFKIFHKRTLDIFKKQTINRWAFDMELLYLAKKYKFQVSEAPVDWVNDENSAVKALDYPKVLCDIFKIRLNDMSGRYKKDSLI